METPIETRRRQKRESERRSRQRRLELIHQLRTKTSTLEASIEEMEKELEQVKDEVFLLRRALHSCSHRHHGRPTERLSAFHVAGLLEDNASTESSEDNSH
jgi:predicted RNase H-like nuclease (RuvC/YqgF family)